MNTYEGMFLIDNDVVRSGWPRAKSLVTDLIEKHGGSIVTARRWDERRLAYPIKKKNRATYMLSYFQLPHDAHALLSRELEIQESCLRYLILRHDEEITEEELKAAALEGDAEHTIPEPPEDSYDEVAVAAEAAAQAERDERAARIAERENPTPKTESANGTEGAAKADEKSAAKADDKAAAKTNGEETPKTDAEGDKKE